MVFLFLKYFVVTSLALLGLLGFVYGMILGIKTFIEGVFKRDGQKLKRAGIIVVAAFLSLLVTILLWPAVNAPIE